ncbi:DUF7003 family protein, partial [Bacillus cereus]|uniref:DUF7003 family protein n=1 Tax=Bacillus cereus TaxID=1396 RepID=UPI0034DA0E88
MQKDILKLLDKKQSKYEFPAFDNEYIDISQVKFSLFFKGNYSATCRRLFYFTSFICPLSVNT